MLNSIRAKNKVGKCIKDFYFKCTERFGVVFAQNVFRFRVQSKQNIFKTKNKIQT